jgi:hypothetical protein
MKTRVSLLLCFSRIRFPLFAGLALLGAAAQAAETVAPVNAANSVVSPTNATQTGTITIALTAPGETVVSLDINFGIRFVPPSRVAVPSGELLRVSAPNLGPLQWRKDGKPIAGATNATLVIDGVKTTDTGTYDVVVMKPFLPGNYVIEVTSRDETAGTVLVEVYEVP